jgi:hypothetical protein
MHDWNGRSLTCHDQVANCIEVDTYDAQPFNYWILGAVWAHALLVEACMRREIKNKVHTITATTLPSTQITPWGMLAAKLAAWSFKYNEQRRERGQRCGHNHLAAHEVNSRWSRQKRQLVAQAAFDCIHAQRDYARSQSNQYRGLFSEEKIPQLENLLQRQLMRE